MAILRFGRRKKRKYPVKRDERGTSARQRCFEMFPDNIPPADISKAVGVKIETVYRYHQQWAKERGLEQQILYLKGVLKKEAPDRERTVELLARTLGIAKEDVEAILLKPHGLRRLVTRKVYLPGHRDADHKRYIALELAVFFSDYLLKHGGSIDDVRHAFERWMKEHQVEREEDDEDIRRGNDDIAIIRAVMKADAENERHGRVQPDELSVQEKDDIIRAGALAARRRNARDAQEAYWLRIGELTADGLTPDQAREKLYQDLIANGDAKTAKTLRAFQDIVHPLKPGGGSPPEAPKKSPPDEKP